MSSFDLSYAVYLITTTVVLWFCYHVRYVRQRRWFEKEGMPEELQQSRLIASEQDFSARFPRPMHGKPDQVFLLRGRVLTVLETKNHESGRIFDSDIVQLSVYACILRNSWWRRFRLYKMADHGYIRLVSKGLVKYIRVDFLSDQDIADIYDQYTRIVKGTVVARHTQIRKLCLTCAFQSKCSKNLNRQSAA